MTPIDLVMYAHGLTFGKAAEQLRACVRLDEPEPITLTDIAAPRIHAGEQMDEETGEIKPTAPRLPWQIPTAFIPVAEAAAPVYIATKSSTLTSPAIPSFILHPPGMLGRIAAWINETAPKRQPELSVAAAITRRDRDATRLPVELRELHVALRGDSGQVDGRQGTPASQR